MIRYAILCGSAPEGFQQKKLVAMHDFLVSKEGGLLSEPNIVLFPNGVQELMLECFVNNRFDEAAEEDDSEVLLYLCAQSVADLDAKLACADCDVVRLGSDEIRKDVIAYYEGLAERIGVKFCVVYEADDAFVSEAVLGYERIG